MGLIRSQSCQTSTNQHPQGDSEIWRFHLGEESREIRKWSKPALSTASAWLCKRICNHNLPLYGLVMGNNASTYIHWVSLAFKIVLNFPRASRTPQVHAWESIIDQNDPSAAQRVRVTTRQFSSPPTFLLCNDSITSSRAITPPHMSPPPANQSRGWWDIDQSEARHGPGIISPRPAALDLITLASF